MRPGRRWLSVVVATTLLLASAACSDDDGEDAGQRRGSMHGWWSFAGAGGEVLWAEVTERLAAFGLEADLGPEVSETNDLHYLEIRFDPVSQDGELEITAIESLKRQGVLHFRPVLSSVDGAGPATPAEAYRPGAVVDLAELDGETVVRTHHLGRAVAGLVSSAEAAPALDGWQVRVTLGEVGLERFNALAARCYTRAPECPTGQLAVVVDAAILSVPAISQGEFPRDAVVIDGLATERDARALAVALDSGPLPWKLTPTSPPEHVLDL